jgi:hypothetical protein
MPSSISIPIFFNLSKPGWVVGPGKQGANAPLTIGHNTTVDFVLTLLRDGATHAPANTPSWTGGIKVLNDHDADFLVQTTTPTGSAGVYTFTITIDSEELRTALNYGNLFAFEVRDSANGIETLPALTLQIAESYLISGAAPTGASGSWSIASGKTLTVNDTITLFGAGTYDLAAIAAAAGTVTNSGTLTADAIILGNGTTVIKSTATDAGVISALGNTPNASGGIVTFNGNIGAATATTINGVAITGTGAMAIGGNIVTTTGIGSGGGGSINLSTPDGVLGSGGNIASSPGTSGSGGSLTMNGSGTASGGSINTSAGGGVAGGSITTSNGGGSIDTRGTGSIGLGVTGTRTTLQGSASGSNKTITLPNATGTVALTGALYAHGTLGAAAGVNFNNGPRQSATMPAFTVTACPIANGAAGDELELWLTGQASNRDFYGLAGTPNTVGIPSDSLLTWPKNILANKVYILKFKHIAGAWKLISLVGGY